MLGGAAKAGVGRDRKSQSQSRSLPHPRHSIKEHTARSGEQTKAAAALVLCDASPEAALRRRPTYVSIHDGDDVGAWALTPTSSLTSVLGVGLTSNDIASLRHILYDLPVAPDHLDPPKANGVDAGVAESLLSSTSPKHDISATPPVRRTRSRRKQAASVEPEALQGPTVQAVEERALPSAEHVLAPAAHTLLPGHAAPPGQPLTDIQTVDPPAPAVSPPGKRRGRKPKAAHTLSPGHATPPGQPLPDIQTVDPPAPAGSPPGKRRGRKPKAVLSTAPAASPELPVSLLEAEEIVLVPAAQPEQPAGPAQSGSTPKRRQRGRKAKDGPGSVSTASAAAAVGQQAAAPFRDASPPVLVVSSLRQRRGSGAAAGGVGQAATRQRVRNHRMHTASEQQPVPGRQAQEQRQRRGGAVAALASHSTMDLAASATVPAARPGRLTAEEEGQLCLVVQDFQALQRTRRQLGSVMHRQPSSQELAQVLGADAGTVETRQALGQTAQRMLMQRNMGLVVQLAAQLYHSPHMKDTTMTMSDLVQVGTQGLLKALTKFNVGRGYRLSTYATPWIKTYMQRACQDEGAVLRLPTHLMEDVNQLQRGQRQLEQAQHGQPPTPQQLASHLGWTLDKVLSVTSNAGLLNSAVTATSLDHTSDSAKDAAIESGLSSSPDELEHELQSSTGLGNSLNTEQHMLSMDLDNLLREVAQQHQQQQEQQQAPQALQASGIATKKSRGLAARTAAGKEVTLEHQMQALMDLLACEAELSQQRYADNSSSSSSSIRRRRKKRQGEQGDPALTDTIDPKDAPAGLALEGLPPAPPQAVPLASQAALLSAQTSGRRLIHRIARKHGVPLEFLQGLRNGVLQQLVAVRGQELHGLAREATVSSANAARSSGGAEKKSKS